MVPAAGFVGGTGLRHEPARQSRVARVCCPRPRLSVARCLWGTVLAAGCARDSSGNVTIEGGSHNGETCNLVQVRHIGGRVRITVAAAAAPGRQVGCQTGGASDLGGGAALGMLEWQGTVGSWASGYLHAQMVGLASSAASVADKSVVL